jgi:hypothetical protein
MQERYGKSDYLILQKAQQRFELRQQALRDGRDNPRTVEYQEIMSQIEAERRNIFVALGVEQVDPEIDILTDVSYID